MIEVDNEMPDNFTSDEDAYEFGKVMTDMQALIVMHRLDMLRKACVPHAPLTLHSKMVCAQQVQYIRRAMLGWCEQHPMCSGRGE